MEQKWKILSSAAGDGASATSFVEEEEEKEKSRWKPAPCVLLSKSSSSSVRARLDPKERKRRKYKSEEENANRCTMQNADPGQNLAREPHTEGGGWRRIFFFSSSFLWRSPTKKPTLANQSGGVALLLLSPGSRCNQTNGDRATHARTKQQAAFCSAPLCDCATSRTTGYGKYFAQWRSH